MGNTIKLQGLYGLKNAKPVNELKNGDVIIWNFGYKSEVVGLTPSKTGKTYVVSLNSQQDGVIRERKMSATNLVAVQE